MKLCPRSHLPSYVWIHSLSTRQHRFDFAAKPINVDSNVLSILLHCFSFNFTQNVNLFNLFLVMIKKVKKVKEGHTPKERRRVAHANLPHIDCRARRWINHYCLWRMANATPDLRLPSQPNLVLIVPMHGWMANTPTKHHRQTIDKSPFADLAYFISNFFVHLTTNSFMSGINKRSK